MVKKKDAELEDQHAVSKLYVDLTIEMNMSYITNIIVVILMDRGNKIEFNRSYVMNYIYDYIKLFGTTSLHDDSIYKKYGSSKKYEDVKKRAESLAYINFPELSDEPNTIKFLKTFIGD